MRRPAPGARSGLIACVHRAAQWRHEAVELAAQRDASDGLLVGRDTYASMRESWGRMTDDPTGVADHLDRVTKYVVSTTLDATDRAHSEILRSVDDVQEVTQRPGADIVYTGSISL